MYILEVAEHFCPLYSNAPLTEQFTTVSTERERERESSSSSLDEAEDNKSSPAGHLPTSAVGCTR